MLLLSGPWNLHAKSRRLELFLLNVFSSLMHESDFEHLYVLLSYCPLQYSFSIPRKNAFFEHLGHVFNIKNEDTFKR